MTGDHNTRNQEIREVPAGAWHRGTSRPKPPGWVLKKVTLFYTRSDAFINFDDEVMAKD